MGIDFTDVRIQSNYLTVGADRCKGNTAGLADKAESGARGHLGVTFGMRKTNLI